MAAVDEYLVRRERRPGAALHAAIRHDSARPWIHQGLSAGHPRERRPIHTWRDLVGDRVCDARRRRQGRRTVLDPEPDQSREHARRRCIATRSSPTSSAPTSTRCRRTSGAAAGPGTPARPAGCIGPASNGYWDFVCAAKRCRSTHAYRERGRVSRCVSIPLRTLRDRGRKSTWRKPRSQQGELDGKLLGSTSRANRTGRRRRHAPGENHIGLIFPTPQIRASSDHEPAPTLSRKSRPIVIAKSARASLTMNQKPWLGWNSSGNSGGRDCRQNYDQQRRAREPGGQPERDQQSADDLKGADEISCEAGIGKPMRANRITPRCGSKYSKIPCVKKIDPTAERMNTTLRRWVEVERRDLRLDMVRERAGDPSSFSRRRKTPRLTMGVADKASPVIR